MHMQAEIRLVFSAAVLEVLRKDNYVEWSASVKTNLMAHDLWEIIEATIEPAKQEDDEVAFKTWSKKNLMALHVIQISCGPDTFSDIIDISSAKIAWDTLAKKYKVPEDTNSGLSLSLISLSLSLSLSPHACLNKVCF